MVRQDLSSLPKKYAQKSIQRKVIMDGISQTIGNAGSSVSTTPDGIGQKQEIIRKQAVEGRAPDAGFKPR